MPMDSYISTQNPQIMKKKLVSYIVSKTNSSKGVEDTDDPGMIRYSAHQYGINSITLKTERDNIPVMDAVNAEYKMIHARTKYLGLHNEYYKDFKIFCNENLNIVNRISSFII